MIEIILSEEEWVNFTAEAKKQMRILKITNKDIANAIQKSESSVARFFSSGGNNRFIAAEIANALEKLKEERDAESKKFIGNAKENGRVPKKGKGEHS